MTVTKKFAYDTLDELSLIQMAQLGDKDAESFLLTAYTPLVKMNAKSYFLVGADKEDLVQEGMIGLYKAIKGYNAEKSVTFKSFAGICITKQLIDAVRRARRKKHEPLNAYVSINQTLGESDLTLESIISSSHKINPETIVISNESVKNIKLKLSKVLSDFEYEVLMLHLDGKNYKEIAKLFDRNAKSIDNALQRIKKKLERVL